MLRRFQNIINVNVKCGFIERILVKKTSNALLHIIIIIAIIRYDSDMRSQTDNSILTVVDTDKKCESKNPP